MVKEIKESHFKRKVLCVDEERENQRTNFDDVLGWVIKALT